MLHQRSKFKNNDDVIPPKGSSTITGAIRNPGYYEIKNDNINSLIDYAGSFEKDAGLQFIS